MTYVSRNRTSLYVVRYELHKALTMKIACHLQGCKALRLADIGCFKITGHSQIQGGMMMIFCRKHWPAAFPETAIIL